MPANLGSPMSPEEKARQKIDAMFVASGWVVQTKDKINLSTARGVAICELSFATGEPDYTLFVDGKAIGTTEAKPEGDTLTGVEEQSTKYVSGVPFGLPAWKTPLPFCYESTGAETFFTNRIDPDPRSRRVFSFHRPETLLAWVQHVAGGGSPLAQRLREMPLLLPGSLWLAQIGDLTYDAKNLDRDVVAPDQIRTVLETFRAKVFTEMFPGRTDLPKTLIFAKDDTHADDIVRLCREVFGKGNDFCKKITYQSKHPETGRGAKGEELIQQFRTSPQLRIAVTVDMIATGTDIKPLECLLFSCFSSLHT
jgi:type I site-specific restriction endonuclease